MDAIEFQRLLDERDTEVGAGESEYYYGSPATALDSLYNNKPVKLFNGSVASKLEVVENFQADYDGTKIGDGWDYSSASGEEFIVQIDVDGQWSYFKVTGFYDSWDNGYPDIFKADKIVKVEKVQISKHEWKEVK